MLRLASLIALIALPVAVLGSEPLPPRVSPAPPESPKAASPCPQETGTHIRHEDGRCLSGEGRSYSRDDLQGSGQRDAGRALRDLDPSVSVSGG